MYLKIANKGEINVLALTLIGASTKTDDETKIGMFGSGNKYAIAYLLRNDFEISIFSGLEKVNITTQKKEFREGCFDVICINGESTSIVTQMGKDWKLWQAIRELYSNALDEGCISFGKVESVSPLENETHFYIKVNDAVEDILFNFDKYFVSDRDVLFECRIGKIYKSKGEVASIYRKGIKCFDTPKQSLFDYDLNDVQLTEGRMAEYYWLMYQSIFNMLFECNNPLVIRTLLCNINGSCFEKEMIQETYNKCNFSHCSTEWHEYLTDKQLCPSGMGGYLSSEERKKTIMLPDRLYNGLVGLIGDKVKPKTFKVSKGVAYVEIDKSKYNKQLSEAYDFLLDAKFDIRYSVKVASFFDKDVLGTIEQEPDCIILSDLSVEGGLDSILNILIEEYIHLKYGVFDETRGFQTAAISEIIMIMKKVAWK